MQKPQTLQPILLRIGVVGDPDLVKALQRRQFTIQGKRGTTFPHTIPIKIHAIGMEESFPGNILDAKCQILIERWEHGTFNMSVVSVWQTKLSHWPAVRIGHGGGASRRLAHRTVSWDVATSAPNHSAKVLAELPNLLRTFSRWNEMVHWFQRTNDVYALV